MIDRQPGGILLNEHERRGRHGVGIGDAQPDGDRANQMGLAGAQGADQSHNGSREKGLAEVKPVGVGRREIVDEECGHRRGDLITDSLGVSSGDGES